MGLLHGGGFGATPPPVARNIMFSIDEGPRGCSPRPSRGVTATGCDMFLGGTMGLAMGCDSRFRVGFEDGVHLPNGKVAHTNTELVEAIVKIVEIFGRRPATVEEARRSFQLKAQAAWRLSLPEGTDPVTLSLQEFVIGPNLAPGPPFRSRSRLCRAGASFLARPLPRPGTYSP